MKGPLLYVRYSLSLHLPKFQQISRVPPSLHCAENPIYVFPEMKLCGRVPNSYIHVSVSNLYNPRIGLPIWLQKNRQTDPGNI
jgi:hypothetical protein